MTITDDIFAQSLGIPEPFNYGLFGLLVVLSSFVPSMLLSRILSLGITQREFSDEALHERFVFNQEDAQALNVMLLEL